MVSPRWGGDARFACKSAFLPCSQALLLVLGCAERQGMAGLPGKLTLHLQGLGSRPVSAPAAA